MGSSRLACKTFVFLGYAPMCGVSGSGQILFELLTGNLSVFVLRYPLWMG